MNFKLYEMGPEVISPTNLDLADNRARWFLILRTRIFEILLDSKFLNPGSQISKSGPGLSLGWVGPRMASWAGPRLGPQVGPRAGPRMGHSGTLTNKLRVLQNKYEQACKRSSL